MFIGFPPANDAVEKLHQSDVQQLGFVMNLTRVWSWRPEMLEAFSALRGTLTAASSLTARELAVIVCASASSLGDSYCALAWGRKLAVMADEGVAKAVLMDGWNESMTDRERALSAWARQVVMDPNGSTQRQVDALRRAGLDDREIFEATLFASLRLAFSTVNDALGVAPDWQVAEAAPEEVRKAVRFGRPAETRDMVADLARPLPHGA
jgi:uncharacterized peroxidase-related enzyme